MLKATKGLSNTSFILVALGGPGTLFALLLDATKGLSNLGAFLMALGNPVFFRDLSRDAEGY